MKFKPGDLVKLIKVSDSINWDWVLFKELAFLNGVKIPGVNVYKKLAEIVECNSFNYTLWFPELQLYGRFSPQNITLYNKKVNKK